MIGRLKGHLIARQENKLLVDVNGVGYELTVPNIVARWAESLKVGDEVDLVTLFLFQMEPGRATPLLLGFRNILEREFFEKLLSVPKLGVRGALQLFSAPIQSLARYIEDNDQKTLMKLPGVGKRRARELIASLQGKVAKFALLTEKVEETVKELEPLAADIINEATKILQSLGYNYKEARKMIDLALEVKPKPTSPEEVVRLVYQALRKQS